MTGARYEEHVDGLPARLVLKELVDWIGYTRVCLVTCPDQPDIARAMSCLESWLSDAPIPPIIELRLRVLLRSVLIMEAEGGLNRTLQTLDEPILETGGTLTLLQVFSTADERQLVALIGGIQGWADEQ